MQTPSRLKEYLTDAPKEMCAWFPSLQTLSSKTMANLNLRWMAKNKLYDHLEEQTVP